MESVRWSELPIVKSAADLSIAYDKDLKEKLSSRPNYLSRDCSIDISIKQSRYPTV